MLKIERDLASLGEFLSLSEFSGKLAGTVYPGWIDLFAVVFGQPYRHQPLVVDGALATGKTTFCQLVALRLLYELMEVGGARAYGISKSEKLHVVLCGNNMVQLLDALLRTAPYFNGRYVATKNTLEFPDNVVVIAAPADDPAIMGLNVVGLIVDNANDSGIDGKRLAATAHDLHRRSTVANVGCVPLPGAIVVTGSGYRNTRAIAENGATYVSMAAWDANPAAWSKKNFRVAIYPKGATPVRIKVSRILEGGEGPADDPGLKIIAVPEELRRDFEADLRGSLRDMAGVAVDETNVDNAKTKKAKKPKKTEESAMAEEREAGLTGLGKMLSGGGLCRGCAGDNAPHTCGQGPGADATPEIKAGDIVRLKSGGPFMTVTSVTRTTATDNCRASATADVAWFRENGGAGEAIFPLACLDLMKVPKTGK